MLLMSTTVLIFSYFFLVLPLFTLLPFNLLLPALTTLFLLLLNLFFLTLLSLLN